MSQERWWHKFLSKGNRWYERSRSEEERVKLAAEERRRHLERRIAMVERVMERRNRA